MRKLLTISQDHSDAQGTRTPILRRRMSNRRHSSFRHGSTLLYDRVIVWPVFGGGPTLMRCDIPTRAWTLPPRPPVHSTGAPLHAAGTVTRSGYIVTCSSTVIRRVPWRLIGVCQCNYLLRTLTVRTFVAPTTCNKRPPEYPRR